MIPCIGNVKNKQIYIERKQISGCLGQGFGGEEGKWGATANGQKIVPRVKKNILKLNCDTYTTL